MANLTASQKKSRNKFIALIIGIIIVAAACAYVIYGGVTAKSNLLENQNFAKALSEVTGKTPLAISENDLAAVKYLEMSYDSTNKQYSLAVGYDDFMAEYTKQLEANSADDAASDETAADENTDAENTAADTSADNTADTANDTSNDNANTDSVDLSTLVKSAVFKGTEDDVFADLKYFTGVETISVYGVKFPADFDFAVYKNLTRGYFGNAGITTVEKFAGLDLENIVSLDFSGNTIEDWSALESISDKVTVFSGYTIEADDDGNYQYVPYTQTLTDYLKEQADSADNADESADNADENADAADGENADGADNAENNDNTDAAADETADENSADADSTDDTTDDSIMTEPEK